MENPTYLGDAVYAFHDGQRIELRLNDHRAPAVIILEPEVLHALMVFAQKCHEEAVRKARG